MRLITCLFAVASLAAALPGGALAQEAPLPRRAEPPPPPRDAPPPPRVDTPPPPRAEAAPPPRVEAPPPPDAPPPRVVVPAPPPREYHSPYPRPVPGPRFYPRPYYPRPRYWGWGWGWYPLYPVYPPPPPPPPSAPPPGQAYPPASDRAADERDRITTQFSVYGAGRTDGYMGGLSFGLDSRFVGFDLDVAALARESFTGPLHEDGSDPATWGSAHVTWTFVSDRSFRLRFETGASMLDLPDSPAVFDRAWRGKTIVGPDLGVSGQLGLTGPVGIEGHARITPFPVRIADTFLGVAVHGGPVGVSAGWRWIDIAGDEVDAPKTFFRGPQVGLVLAF